MAVRDYNSSVPTAGNKSSLPLELMTDFLSQALDGVWFLDIEKQENSWCDDRLVANLDIRDERETVKSNWWLALLTPEDQKNFWAVYELFKSSSAEQVESKMLTLRYFTANQQVKLFRCYLRPSFNVEGSLEGVYCLHQKHRAKTVAESTSEHQPNEVDADYRKLISHDLRAPLRGLKNLIQWLESDLESAPEKAPENLRLMERQVQRMDKLLIALTTYSQVGIEPKDNDAFDSLTPWQISFAEFNGSRIHNFSSKGVFPILTQGGSCFRRVCEQLVSNAIHHSMGDAVDIIVEVEETTRMCQFAIEDNGPGFDEGFAPRAFELGSKFKSKDELEGSGIGLATVKKIIEFYGGKIWLGETEGDGARLVFLWPK